MMSAWREESGPNRVGGSPVTWCFQPTQCVIYCSSCSTHVLETVKGLRAVDRLFDTCETAILGDAAGQTLPMYARETNVHKQWPSSSMKILLQNYSKPR